LEEREKNVAQKTKKKKKNENDVGFNLCKTQAQRELLWGGEHSKKKKNPVLDEPRDGVRETRNAGGKLEMSLVSKF